MATCEECGSRQVLEVEIDGVLLERCPLCDHVQGDEAGVAHVQDRIEAEELGYRPGHLPARQVARLRSHVPRDVGVAGTPRTG